MADSKGSNPIKDFINVVSPFGEIGSLPTDQAHEALNSSGYRMPTEDEIHSQKLQDQYGGAQGQLFAGTLAAARTASLGLSDIALEKLPPEYGGFTRDQLNGLKEANPISSGIGDAVGLLRDPLALGKLIGNAGKGTTELAKRGLGAAGVAFDKSKVAQVLISSLEHGVQGGIFGGVQGTANDYALGDPGLNSEKVLSNVGYGYFIGGSSAPALKLLGYGVTPAIKKGVNAVANLRNELIGSGFGDEAGEALVSKILPKRLSEAITDRQLNLDTKGQAAHLRKMANNLNTLVNSVHEEIGNLGKDINDEAYDAVLKGASKTRGAAQDEASQFLNETVDTLKNIIPEDKELNSIKPIIKTDSLKSGSISKSLMNGLKKVNKILDSAKEMFSDEGKETISLGYPRQKNLERMEKTIKFEMDRAAQEKADQGPPLEGGVQGDPNSVSDRFEKLRQRPTNRARMQEMVQNNMPQAEEAAAVPQQEPTPQAPEAQAPQPEQQKGSLSQFFDNMKASVNRFLHGPETFGPTAAARALHEEDVRELQKYIAPKGKKPTSFQQAFGEMKAGEWQFDMNKMHKVMSEPDLMVRSHAMRALDDFFEHIQSMPDNLEAARKAIPNNSWKKATLDQIIENSQKTHDEAYKDYLAGINKRRPLYGWKDYAPVLIAKWHPVLAAAIEAYDWYQDPIHATHGLSLVERVLGQTTKKSLDLIDDIFSNPSPKIRVLIDENKQSLSRSQTKRDDHRKELQALAQQPERVADKMQEATKDLTEVAPNISQQLQIAAGNALSFLNSKMPQNMDHANPLSKPMPPSQPELAKFERYRNLVEDPMLALKQIGNRTITHEAPETLQSVYPKLYDELKQNLLQKAFEHKEKGKEIPYQTKQAISLFIGEPLDASLSPQSIVANQMAYQASQLAQQQAQVKSKMKAPKSSASERMANDYSAMSGD